MAYRALLLPAQGFQAHRHALRQTRPKLFFQRLPCRRRGLLEVSQLSLDPRLLAIKIELRKKMHDPIAKTGAWMKRMLQGHLNYFAVSGNHPSLWWFVNKVRRLWLMSLRRCSQRHASAGRSSSGSSPASFRQSGRYTRCQVTASTPKPEGGARCVSSARRDLRGGRGAILVSRPYRWVRGCKRQGCNSGAHSVTSSACRAVMVPSRAFSNQQTRGRLGGRVWSQRNRAPRRDRCGLPRTQ
jgi:hypothetical protein